MTALVEDLLLLARLDEGRELIHVEVDLTRVVIDCVADAQVAGPDHTWKLHLPDEAVALSSDQARLHQVIANLLANARIHTPAGSTVDVTLAQQDGRALIKVRDNGPGIPAAQRKTLFERFTRGDSSRTRATGSTGLGLAIVQAVVASHGGKVSVTSRKGRTEFVVSLPL
jgi:two-component system OmpR family sensor kinase